MDAQERIEGTRPSAALLLDPFGPLDAAQLDELGSEGDALLAFLRSGAGVRELRFV